jgi:hypothetical protein
MPTIHPAKSEMVYLVRDDSMFFGGVPESEKQRFIDTLQKYVSCPVVMFSASKQIEFCDTMARKLGYDLIISLDKWYEGDFQLDISRNFTHNQEESSGYLIKNYDKFLDFLRAFKDKSINILIVDDDIITKGTVNHVENILRGVLKRVKEVAHLDMLKCYDPQQGKKIYDIIDLRDFIPCAKFGGLMINGERKLYKYPEVDLVSRMKLKSPKDAKAFSEEWYAPPRKVEIGHFYLSEFFEPNCLNYLKNFKFQERDELILFLDDFSEKSRVLEVDKLVELAEKITQRKVAVVYESEMIKYSEKTIDYLCKSSVVSSIPDISANGIKLKRNGEPTCFLLSLTWTLFRAGFFNNTNADVLTIINKNYFKLEQKVVSCLPPEIKKRVEYIFF